MKKVWFAVNGVLLALSAVSLTIGAENVFGVCATLLILLSYPGNLLFGWLFFAHGDFYKLPGAMILMMFMCSFVGYVQWFVLLPQVVQFIKQTFGVRGFKDDFDDFKVSTANTKQMTEANLESTDAHEWQAKWYDGQKRTPVERILNRDSS